MFRLICIAIGYCIGCIQTAFIMGKLCKTDLSKKGSGNLGTTNALRVLGFKAGAVTFIGDILKGVVSFIIARWLFPDMGILAGIYACAGTILGHDFPFYLHFKGGKGIVAVALSGYISLGSMLFSIAIPVCAFFFQLPLEGALVLTALTILALWKHRANIGRLRAGNENKFTLTKKV